MSTWRLFAGRVHSARTCRPSRHFQHTRVAACLPPPALSGSAASNPRSTFGPRSLAYLGDAVWEAHTRRVELELESAEAARWAAAQAPGPEEGSQPLATDLDNGAGRGQARGRGRGRSGRGRGARGRAQVSPSGGEGGDGTGLPNRQQRKQWATASFQALVYDALAGDGLPLPPGPGQAPSGVLTAPDAPAPEAPAPAAAPRLALTPAELEVLRSGRNAAVGSGSVPQGMSAGEYKKATAVEVLVAHLYLTDPPRCEALVTAALAAGLGLGPGGPGPAAAAAEAPTSADTATGPRASSDA